MELAKSIHTVHLDGNNLTLDDLVAVARYNAQVELTKTALDALRRSRALADKIASEKRVAYGITTGFGDFATVAVPEDMSAKLSNNLIYSHCTATGEPYPREAVRAMMLLRANALCFGVSGVRPVLVEKLVDMLNRGVTPVVPQRSRPSSPARSRAGRRRPCCRPRGTGRRCRGSAGWSGWWGARS